MKTAKIEIPPKLIPLFNKPRGELRYRGAYGGRGSAKSMNFALMAAVMGYAEPLRILCTREFQVSIKESFHAELKKAINMYPWLKEGYDIGVDYLRGHNGTEFIFKGLRRNISSVKSMSDIDICIVEEAEDVPESSWIELVPTIRKPGSEIWPVWNPRDPTSPVDKRFRQNTPARSMIVEMNWRDNPWFPVELEEERQQAQQIFDPKMYNHIWEGAYLEISDAQVFANKFIVDEFEPGDDWDGPYYGADWGFGPDPTAAIEMWRHNDKLYVRRESYAHKLELDSTANRWKRDLPGIEDHVVRADDSRPDTISYIKRNGIPHLVGAQKGKGSVQDGIDHMKSYDSIVIHPDCIYTQKEMRLYSHKVNNAGDILPDIVDENNHLIDAARYALRPLIKPGRKSVVIGPATSGGQIGKYI